MKNYLFKTVFCASFCGMMFVCCDSNDDVNLKDTHRQLMNYLMN